MWNRLVRGSLVLTGSLILAVAMQANTIQSPGGDSLRLPLLQNQAAFSVSSTSGLWEPVQPVNLQTSLQPLAYSFRPEQVRLQTAVLDPPSAIRLPKVYVPAAISPVFYPNSPSPPAAQDQTGTPEPSSLLLTGGALLFGAVAIKRRKPVTSVPTE